MVRSSSDELSIIIVIQVMSGILDIFVGLRDLMWTALGVLRSD